MLALRVKTDIIKYLSSNLWKSSADSEKLSSGGTQQIRADRHIEDPNAPFEVPGNELGVRCRRISKSQYSNEMWLWATGESVGGPS
jgi:hypothetical protein